MKQTATMLLFLLLAMAGQAKEQKRLVIITVDGMRCLAVLTLCSLTKVAM